MINNRKGYKVPATVIPGHDSFPVVDSNDVAGNLMYFDDVSELVTIPAAKRKLGMFAFVNNEGKHYKLVNNKAVLDISCWEPYELVSKEYVDNAIASASLGGGSGTTVDLSEYAKKTEIPDISNLATKSEIPDISNLATKAEIPTIPDVSGFETSEHAEATYSKKTDLEALEGVVPKVVNDVFDIPVGSSNDPLVLELEIPNGTVGINVIAIAEVEEEETANNLASINYAENPITGSGLESNEFGVALEGSAIPTAADFVTYGE